jgi:acyl carrier protein
VLAPARDLRWIMTKTREQVFAHLRETLVELFEIDADKISPDANLYTDLDIDSIDAVDLVLKLKEFTGQKIQPQQFKHVRTVNDVVDAVMAILATAK